MYFLKTWFNDGSQAWVVIVFILAALIAAAFRFVKVQKAGLVWYNDKRFWFFIGIAVAIFLFVQFFITSSYK